MIAVNQGTALATLYPKSVMDSRGVVSQKVGREHKIAPPKWVLYTMMPISSAICNFAAVASFEMCRVTHF